MEATAETSAAPEEQQQEQAQATITEENSNNVAAVSSSETQPRDQQEHHSHHYLEHHHHHVGVKEGIFPQPKVFAAPIIPIGSRPGSAGNSLGVGGLSANNIPTSMSSPHINYDVVNPNHGNIGRISPTRTNSAGSSSRKASPRNVSQQQNAGGGRSTPHAAQMWAGGKNRGNLHSASTRYQRVTSPEKELQQQIQEVIQGQHIDVQQQEYSQDQKRRGNSPTAVSSGREHWSVGSPGTEAAAAAKEQENIYSGMPRRGVESQNTNSSNNNYVSPRPSIPDRRKNSSTIVSSSSASGVVRGRSFLGEAALRPTSATSGRSGGGGSSRPGSANTAFPPRKVITAELTALRAKYVAAGSQHQQQRPSTSPQNSSSRRSAGRNVDPRHLKNRVDAIVDQLNAQPQQQQQQQQYSPNNNNNNGMKIIDLGSGESGGNTYNNNNNNQNNFSPGSSGRVPVHLQPDVILRRQKQTQRVLRKEDKTSKEQDKRIRNFRARALVSSATEMSKMKGQAELKEIQDKLVWAKMRKDALDSEIYDLEEYLETLPGHK